MARLIRHYDNANQPIVSPDDDTLGLIYFNLLRLKEGQSVAFAVPGYEIVCVALSGTVDIDVDGEKFDGVGRRESVWEGRADSVYATTGATVRVTGRGEYAEVAVAGGRCDERHKPFRIAPDDVELVDVGSVETHSHRRIFHILGQNANGRAGNLLVSELYADGGCWNGYPPHKHDEERPPEETFFEELYHYRFRPETGFGGQFAFKPRGEAEAFMTRNGDTFCLDAGYHPTVTSPLHEEYIFTIIVGKHQRSLVQFFKEEHRWIMDELPGLQAMRDKFK